MLARVPGAPERARARRSSASSSGCASADLTKVPGIAETLDWAAALHGARRRRADARRSSTRRSASSSSTRRTSGTSAATHGQGLPGRDGGGRRQLATGRCSGADGGRRAPAARAGGRHSGGRCASAGLQVDLGGGDRLRAVARRSSTSATASRCGPPARRCSCAGATTRPIYDAVFDRYWRAEFAMPPDVGAGPDGAGRGRRARRARARRRRARRERPRAPTTCSARCLPGRRRRASDGRRRRRRGRHLARRLQPRRGAAPPRVRPDDPGGAARRRAAGRPAGPAAGAAADAPLRAPSPRPADRAAGDVPAQPRRPAARS